MLVQTAFAITLGVLFVAAGLMPAAQERPPSPASRYGDDLYWGRKRPAPPSRSPVSLQELELLRRTLLLDDEDVRWLRESRAVLEPQVDALLDVWYGFVGSNPHLLASFANQGGEPQGEYLAAVRGRFGRWVLDTAEARFDQEWLDYSHEIGLRHHRSGKNATDGADAAAEVPFRYLLALHQPITATLRPFLEAGGRPAKDVDRMQDAWRKAVLLQVILWSHPYVHEGSF
ncbi:MAG TPA: protoglobin domain-containing protein [Planctomycetota bacterium]|nr:protoglobin domain-containing protein [Planctomycetota bacterium]